MNQTRSPDDLARLKRECRSNPARFNRRILGRPAYWWRQTEIAESVRDFPVTLVPAGNMVGKSFVAAGLLHWFLQIHPGSLVLATAPSQTQLEEVLWKEVERAYNGSRIPLGGRLLKSPLKIDLGNGWQALAYSTQKTERLSGHHAGDMLAILDESSGIAPEIVAAVDSCNPSRLLMLGNPLRPDGAFYERCQRAQDGDNPDVNLIRIPSTDSPDIGVERSRRGLADAAWLRKSRNDYGESSIWWLSHVLALFPDSATDSLVSRTWLDLAGRTIHVRSGPARMSLDPAEGNDGDPAGYMVRDDNGILGWKISPKWGMEKLAEVAAKASARWGIDPQRITYDATGVGSDFGNRLKARGIDGARPYKGGYGGGDKFANLRTAAAWVARQRLDPNRMVKGERGVMAPQHPFAIPAELLAAGMRRELQAAKYEMLRDRKVGLEPKEALKKALGGKSPTYADLFFMTFAYPGA